METKKPSSNQAAFKWGIIYVVTAIVITYAFQFLNVDQTSPAKYISYIPFIAFLLLAQKEYKDQLGGYLKFGEGFMTGFKYSVISGILLAIFIYLYFSYLSPQVYEQVLTSTQTQLEAKGQSSDQVEVAMNFMKSYGIITTTIGMLIGTTIVGSVIALIGAAIFKRDRPPFDMDIENSYTDPTV